MYLIFRCNGLLYISLIHYFYILGVFVRTLMFYIHTLVVYNSLSILLDTWSSEKNSFMVLYISTFFKYVGCKIFGIQIILVVLCLNWWFEFNLSIPRIGDITHLKYPWKISSTTVFYLQKRQHFIYLRCLSFQKTNEVLFVSVNSIPP